MESQEEQQPATTRTSPMKTPKQNSKGLCLKTSNNPWKWMAGATAATAAGVTASQASTITINLVNNYISATGGNQLNADLTGDGRPDLRIANAAYFYYLPQTDNGGPFYTGARGSAAVDLNGVHAHVYHTGFPYDTLQLGSRSAYFNFPYGTPLLTGSIPIFFKDLRINGGTRTNGFLEVTVSVGGGYKIQLDSFTYNSGSAVPDQGSSLALLAMGAGGVLAFRRWRAAQGRS